MRDWRNWVLLGSVLALCLVIGEVFVRIFLDDAIVLFPRYHAAATYGDFTIRRLRPDTTFRHTSTDGSWRFDVNQQGFRNDHDVSHDKADGVVRVITLGDSHTLGFEVRQDRTYAAVIERYLAVRGWDAEVINAGVSGFSTAEAAVFLEHEALKYDPDVVVYGFYANDLEDNIKADLFRLKDQTLVINKTSHLPGIRVLEFHNSLPVLRWLSENSYAYSLVMNTVWNTAKSFLLSTKRAELTTELAIPTRTVGDYEKRLAARLVARMHRLCEENSVTFIILDIPQTDEDEEFKNSIPSDLLADFERSSDALIESEEVLGPYRYLAEFQVPHGQRHISELSHLLLGVSVARTIHERLGPRGDHGGAAAMR